LHLEIQEHQTVDILRGLPEGSRLSPTLFGIFVADFIHELQTKFPHAVINLAPGLPHNGTTRTWIGGLLYVDDLALMSTCPLELQAMLHVCQGWSIRNRLQINTQKTKVTTFFETPSLQKARGGKHRPGPTLPPFHIHAPFPTSSPCSYLITEVLQFEYLGLILDPKLTMHLATTEAIRRAAHGQSVTQAVSYSLRYDKKKFPTHPNTKLGSMEIYCTTSFPPESALNPQYY